MFLLTKLISSFLLRTKFRVWIEKQRRWSEAIMCWRRTTFTTRLKFVFFGFCLWFSVSFRTVLSLITRLTAVDVWTAMAALRSYWKESIWRCTAAKWWRFLDQKEVERKLCSMWSLVVRQTQLAVKFYWTVRRLRSRFFSIAAATSRMRLTSLMVWQCRRHYITHQRLWVDSNKI